jgi:hypothetical protein
MIRNRIFIKSLAVFLVLEIIASIGLPSVSWALTAGPTAPEATSFEPVDMTDMVDLISGDLTYNVPLIEVPGPAGSYPLSLSYHAGIQPGQEASWTGLGFTLNPGSITRFVNGYPDDHDNVTNVDRTYWSGGVQTSTSVGIAAGFSVGPLDVASVSAGLSFAQDTYKGRGVGFYVGASLGFGIKSVGSLGVNVSGGVSPFGDSYSSVGISLGVGAGETDALNLSASIGADLNSDGKLSMGVTGGINVGNRSLIDASIGTGNSKGSLKVGGGSIGVYNGNSNRQSIESNGFQFDIPIYIGVSIRLSEYYKRYWVDETAAVQTFGSLYMGNVLPNFNNAFDTYDLLDPDLDFGVHDDEEKVLGGSFPDTDYYNVTGQGIAGNIKPYHFQQYLYRQDKKDGADGDKILTKSYRLNENPELKPVEYRFVNDFSNRYEYNPGDFEVNNNLLNFDFGGSPLTGESGSDGFNNNHLAGSKHIEWYSNQDILLTSSVNPFQQGFINCVAEDFERSNDRQVGGYSITNSSGVTYHYALPVYSYNERAKTVNSEANQEDDGLTYSLLTKPERYAHSWLLTAVTGPDFVDKNGNHIADHGDWGYWVNFEYKKWLEDYKWRNPGEGTNPDLDGEFEFYSAGEKEIYYLERIVTETHVAIFEKSIRLDGREVEDLDKGKFHIRPIINNLAQNLNCHNLCKETYCGLYDCPPRGVDLIFDNCNYQCDANYPLSIIGYIVPRPMLRLDKIKLFNYQDVVSARIDDEFVLRSIDFSYDYSLQDDPISISGVPNSYLDNNSGNNFGKLTLKELKFFGKQKISHIPSIKFDYGNNAAYNKDKVDNWGYYKSDYNPELIEETNELIGRLTTSSSAPDTDAWSLTSIETPLGASIKVEYESDRYENVALAKDNILRVKSVTDYAQNQLKITFWEQGIDLTDYFDLNQTTEIDLIGVFKVAGAPRNCIYEETNEPVTGKDITLLVNNNSGYFKKMFSDEVQITDVNNTEGYIIITDTEYYNTLKNEVKKFNKNLKSGVEDVKCEYTYAGARAWPDFIPACSIVIPKSLTQYGGGLRTKSITIINPLGDGRVTSYEYANGTTSYEPGGFQGPKLSPEFVDYLDDKDLPDAQDVKKLYKTRMLKRFYKIISIARLLPPPGVMYGQVTVREKNITADQVEHDIPNYTVYEFETYKEGMIGVIKQSIPTISGTNIPYEEVTYNKTYLNKVSIKDYSSRVGSLKSITLFDNATNLPVSKTINEYLHDGLSTLEENSTTYENKLESDFNNQGLIEETFTRARIVLFKQASQNPYFQIPEIAPKNNERHLLSTISKMETFPVIGMGKTSINYKTGVTTSSHTLAFDFYSGEPTEVLTTDSYGNRYKSVTVPAYHQYPEMASKVGNVANKNMLTQEAAQYSFLVDDQSNPTGLLSASTQTWSTQVKVLDQNIQPTIWRKQSAYQWESSLDLNPDGSYPYSDFSQNAFNWTTPEANANWRKTSELTLYDLNSHGLEALDINGNFAATRMDNNNNKVIASALNARYTEMASSGAEQFSGNTNKDGGVARGTGNPTRAHAHTGQFSLLVGSGGKGFNYTLTPGAADLTRKYRASVWVYAPGEAETQAELNTIKLQHRINGNIAVSVHPTLQKSKSKSWYQLNLDITPDGNNEILIEVTNDAQREVYFDDFRVHPLDGSLTSFVYDPFSGELTYMLDENNFYTKFEYDAMGRLIRTSKELLNYDFGPGKESVRPDAVLKEIKYNYGKGN